MLSRLIASTLLGGLLLAAVPVLSVGQDNKTPADKAVIVVKLPAGAELTIEGDATKAVGAERRFVTPALRPGVTYSYTFAATWSEKGKVRKDQKKVLFQAGQTVEVVFGKAPEVKDKDKKKADEEKKKKDEEAKKKKDEAYKAAMDDAKKAMQDKKYADAIKAYDAALKAKPGDKAATDAKAAAVKAMDDAKADEKKKKDAEEKKKKDEEAKKKKDEEEKKKKDEEKKKKDEEAKKKKKDEEAKKKAEDYTAAIIKAAKAVEDVKFKEAVKAYDVALKAKPGDKDASNARALAVKALDARKKAEEAKKKADEEKKKADEDKKKDEEAKKDLLPPPTVEKNESSEVKSRTFDFTYDATVTGLQKGKKAKVWVPVAQDNEAQKAKLVGYSVKGGDEKADVKFTTEKQYGNRTLFVETTPDEDGKIHLKLTYRVTRREVKGETGKAMEKEELLKRFLQPDALVPIDGKPLELIKNKDLPDDPMKKARVLYDVVNDHLKYSKDGEGWGRGDSVWVCDSKFGNCSDFHSLFISLARSQKLPAKFEMGFPIPTKRGEGTVGGYHCWAFFRPEGKAWVPVDISEANKEPKLKDYFFGNLTEDRVTFTTGRDLTLEPKQSAKAVNFLIYPYVEVDSKEYDQAKIEKKFAYKDVAEKK